MGVVVEAPVDWAAPKGWATQVEWAALVGRMASRREGSRAVMAGAAAAGRAVAAAAGEAVASASALAVVTAGTVVPTGSEEDGSDQIGDGCERLPLHEMHGGQLDVLSSMALQAART